MPSLRIRSTEARDTLQIVGESMNVNAKDNQAWDKKFIPGIADHSTDIIAKGNTTRPVAMLNV